MTLSKSQNEKLDTLETFDSSNIEGGMFVFDGSEEEDIQADERIVYLYADYGLLRADSDDQMKIWGNWARLASRACEDRRVISYISRYDLRDDAFVLRCTHHSDRDDGIYLFHIAVGG